MPQIHLKHIPLPLIENDPLQLPYWELTASADGPTLLIVAAQHGNEVQGSEALRRFILLAGEDLHAGKIFAVPFCNPLAVQRRRHHDTQGPEEPVSEQPERNMNRQWPGDPAGNDIQRTVHAIYSALGARATHVVDIHCWNRFWAAAGLPRRDRPESLELASISALPFARRSDPPSWTQPPSDVGRGFIPRRGWREGEVPPPRRGMNPRPTEGAAPPTTLGSLFDNTNRPSLTFELAGQFVVEENQVALGLRCLTNIARHLGMMPGEPEGTDEGPVWTDDHESTELLAPGNGLFVGSGLEPGDWVEEGQLLGHLIGEDNLATIPLCAPAGGRLAAYGAHRAFCDVALPAMHPYASVRELIARIVIAPRGERPA